MANLYDPVSQEELDFQTKLGMPLNMASSTRASSNEDQLMDDIKNGMLPTQNEDKSDPVNSPLAVKQAPVPQTPPPTNETQSGLTAPDDNSEISRLLSYLKPQKMDLNVEGKSVASDQGLKEAQGARDKEIFANRLGMAGQTAADALTPLTAKSSDEFYKQGITLADRKIADYKAKVENQKFDPKSEYSEGLRKFAQKFGVNVGGNVSGETMEKLFPFVTRAYDSDLDNKARVLSMVENKSLKKESKEQTATEKRTKDYNDFITKQGNVFAKAKEYEGLQKVTQVREQVKDAINNPSGVKDVAALYGIVKGLDPDSVVRPGEIELARQAQGLWGVISNKISRLGKNPRVIDNKLMRDIDEYLDLVADQKAKSYFKRTIPIQEQVKKRGGSIETDLPAIVPMWEQIKHLDQDSLKKSESNKPKAYKPQEESGITNVMTKFGLTREQAISELTKAGKLK